MFKPVLDDEVCPVGSTMEPRMHCIHWYDGGECCRCKAPAQKEEDNNGNH